MKLQYPTGVTTQFFGRNPLAIHYFWEGFLIAPHANTERFRYTVPANRRAVITAQCVAGMRMTAAAPVDELRVWLLIYDLVDVYNICMVDLLNNNVGAHEIIHGVGQFYLEAGHYLEMYSYDASTGGTTNIQGYIGGVEYDP
jgi:hypothetical protein